jgi:hypothetical protein
LVSAAYTPELDTTQFPPTLQIKSIHNTPIEGLWHWFLQTFGVNIKDIIHSGFTAGIYNPNNPVHPYGAFPIYNHLFYAELIDKTTVLLVMAEDTSKST